MTATRPRACNWSRCGTTHTRLFPGGWRCSAHTPAALAGRPEISASTTAHTDTTRSTA